MSSLSDKAVIRLSKQVEKLQAQLAEIAELPRLVPDLGDYGSILDMVPEQGFEPTAYLDADKVQAIINREKGDG